MEDKSDFEQEEEIVLDGQVSPDGEEDNQQKADEEMPQEEGMSPPQELQQDLADPQSSEDIMQRVAQNLALFKENKELMEQIKQAKPELYASILGLLQNMVDLAKMVSAPEEQPAEEEPMNQEAQSEMPQEEGSEMEMGEDPFPK
jgi:hypothetical protein